MKKVSSQEMNFLPPICFLNDKSLGNVLNKFMKTYLMNKA